MFYLNNILILALIIYCDFLNGYDSKGFDDSILFDINWPGSNIDQVNVPEEDGITLMTSYKEKYKCILPNIQEKEPNHSENYDGPSAIELISPLFNQAPCSYRIESYWAYEVCHGRHIRQYHEDREGKKVRIQEYILGYWDKNYYKEVLLEEAKLEEKRTKNSPAPVKKIDGTSFPYFEVLMSNGTRCELNQNRPRQTKVIYVCYIHGKHEVFSFKEISICVYEVVILSPLLCTHPKYKPQETGENQINCLPLEDNPKKPRNLMKMRKEAIKLRRKADLDHIRVELHPLDLNEKEETSKISDTPIDVSPIESFLAGKNCLNGGLGWWKYEFCYGKSVKQFHVDRDGSRTAINLGRFNKAKHLEWIENHPQKRPKPIRQRTHLSHFYSDGDICDKTGKPRHTEVKLKCLENTSRISAVSLYLLEPKYCEYILGVESPLICDILMRADENGLIEGSEDDAVVEDEIATVNIIRV